MNPESFYQVLHNNVLWVKNKKIDLLLQIYGNYFLIS